jgi:hypothetical protein
MPELEVLPEEPAPARPSPAPRPAPPRPPAVARSTQVYEEDEGEDLRRRIARIPEPEIALDELREEEAPAQDTNPGVRNAPAETMDSPAPIHIPVEIEASRGQREMTVPIEVTIGRPGGEVHLHLNIALKIRISG